MKKGMTTESVPAAKIKPKPMLPKAFKGKELKSAKPSRTGSRPAGGGKKGY